LSLCLVAAVAVTWTSAGTASAAAQRAQAHVVGAFVPGPRPTKRIPPRTPQSLRFGAITTYSSNWAGYVQAGRHGTFTSVRDTWQVPTVSTAPAGTQFSADWVGIGGVGNHKLVQAGTESDNVNGTAFYQAWTEMLRAPSVPLPMTIHGGDLVTTLVQETAPNVWLMQVTDDTTHVTQSVSSPYRSSGASVEAIHEVPEICASRSCSLGALASTTNAVFDPGSYTTVLDPNPQSLLVPAADKEHLGVVTRIATLDQVVMVAKIGAAVTAVASPSGPDADNDGFAVADGGAPPGAPPS
jgi:hypothetical protein